MPPSGKLFLLLACTAMAAPPKMDTSSNKCFATAPGTIARAGTKVKLGVRNWASHKISSSIVEIVLKEYLGFTVDSYDLTSADSDNWGKDIAAGDFDIDVESWKASMTSAQYAEFVTTKETVEDAGSPGYFGRRSLFTTDKVLAKFPMASWYNFYQDPAVLESENYVRYGDATGLKAAATGAGETWPLCPASMPWCSSLNGEYWAPTVCQATPEKCAVALLENPMQDKGRFEQLTQNHGMYLIHGWAGKGLQPMVTELAKTKNVVFQWWGPDTFPIKVKATRIAFPDWQGGCDSVDSQDPTGVITCDTAFVPLVKLMTTNARTQIPEAYTFMKELTVLEGEMDQLMASTTEAGGTKTTFDAACDWVKGRESKIKSWIANCIYNTTSPQVFDEKTLKCKTVTMFVNTPYTKTCIDPITPNAVGKKARANKYIKIVNRSWASVILSHHVAAIILKDFMGYGVIDVGPFAGQTGVGTKDVIPNLLAEGFDLDAESWQIDPAQDRYINNFGPAGPLVDLGGIGYEGRAGYYLPEKVAKKYPAALYYKFYQDEAKVATMNFPYFGDAEAATPKLPTPTAFAGKNMCALDWCNTTFPGYWIPPQCKNRESSCILSFHPTSGYDTAYLETLTRNHNLHIIWAYYGWSQGDVMADLIAKDMSAIGYWYTPDSLITRLQAKRVSFPDTTFGCANGNTYNPDTGSMLCDYGWLNLAKPARMIIKENTPEAYTVLKQLKIWSPDMDWMLNNGPDGPVPVYTGGGDKPLAYWEAACAWVKKEKARIIETIAPPCLTSPKPLSEFKFGDAIYQPASHSCVKITCLPNNIIQASAGGANCGLVCSEGLVPKEDRTGCKACPVGEVPDRATGKCMPCPLGHACPPAAEKAIPCDLGKFANATSMTSCLLCGKGTYTDVLGQPKCISCEGTLTGGSTENRAAISSTECVCGVGAYRRGPHCVLCTEGMLCEEVGMNEPMQLNRHWVKRLTPKDAELQDYSVYRCRDSKECPAGPVETCAAGRMDISCGNCMDNYFQADEGECEECTGSDTLPLIFTVAVAVIALAPLYRYAITDISKQRLAAITAALALGQMAMTVQALGVFTDLDVTWSEPVASLLKLLGIFAFDIDVIKVQCILGGDSPVLNFVCTLMICPGFMCMVALMMLIGRYVAGKKQLDFDHFFNLVGLVMLVFYISITIAVVRPLHCIMNPNGTSSMASNPAVVCWEDDEHTTLVILGVIGLILYPISIMAFIGHVTLRYPALIASGQGLQVLVRYRFLFQRFKPNCYYWGICYVIRNFFISLAPVIFRDNAIWQVVFIQIVIITSVTLTAYLTPWRTAVANACELWSTIGLCVFMQVAAFFVGTDGNENMLGIVLSGLIFGIIFFVVCVLTQAAYRRFFPSLDFAAFLCHHKEAAGSLARFCKTQMEKESGQVIFLDSDQLDDIELIFEIVRAMTKNLVILQSKMVLTRPWCAGEITTAYGNKIPIIPVGLNDYEEPGEEFLKELETRWSEQQKNHLLHFGIEMSKIRDAYLGLKEFSQITLDRFAPLSEQQLVLSDVTGACNLKSARATLSRSMSATSPAAGTDEVRIVIAGRIMDAETRCTCQILRSMIQKHVRVETDVLMTSEALQPYIKSVDYFCAVLSQGLLQDQMFAEILFAIEQQRSPDPVELRPVLIDTGFQFPGAEYYADLAQAGDKGKLLAQAYRRMLNVIAVGFNVMGSSGMMNQQIDEICKRMAKTSAPGDKWKVADRQEFGSALPGPKPIAAQAEELVIECDI